MAARKRSLNYYSIGNLWGPLWYCEEARKAGLFPETRLLEETITFVNELLDIPEKFCVEVILPIGHPSKKPGPKSSKASSKVHYEKYKEE